MNFRPLLAHNALECPLKFPLLASPKIDGIRCIIWNGTPVSRTLKPIPNDYIRSMLTDLPNGLDGELVVGNTFQESTSGIMSQSGEPDFHFWVFDQAQAPRFTYTERMSIAMQQLKALPSWQQKYIDWLPQTLISEREDLVDFEQKTLSAGYEGVMLRDPQSKYKFGRSTPKEGILGKIKRFEDAEATIVGVVPLMRNFNKATKNALGLTQRSNDAINKHPDELLGALECKSPNWLETFEIGTGFTEAMRRQLWREPPIGQLAKFRYLPHGTLYKPRHPVFLGLRSPFDV